MNTLQNLLMAGDGLGKRMEIFRTTAAQARERGERNIQIPLSVLWEPADAQALSAWEAAKAEALGQVPLFPIPPDAVPRDLLGTFPDLSERDQEGVFGNALGRLDKKAGGGLDDGPWLDLWIADHSAAMERLNYALNHRKPLCGAIPSAAEVTAWKGGSL